jgi:hypothetical protein
LLPTLPGGFKKTTSSNPALLLIAKIELFEFSIRLEGRVDHDGFDVVWTLAAFYASTTSFATSGSNCAKETTSKKREQARHF